MFTTNYAAMMLDHAACLAAAALLLCPQARTHLSVVPPLPVETHLRQVAKELPAGSVLRHELEAGDHGDGVRYLWMDLAEHDGVKRVEVEVNFTWHRGLHDLQPVRVMFFSSYDESAPQITDPAALEKFDRDGLKSLVEQAALDRARQGTWFESPEHQHPAKRGRVPASTGILLYDDPWLPLLPVWYGIRDVTWSPLEDAAFVGDQVAVKRLLAERHVNKNKKDLDKALGAAALGDHVAVIHLLLDGGANVNARLKNGATPLTIAVANGRLRSVDVLLKAGANPSSRNRDGDSALSIAIQHRYAQIAAILKQAGGRE
jgi:hypothetical protein